MSQPEPSFANDAEQTKSKNNGFFPMQNVPQQQKQNDSNPPTNQKDEDEKVRVGGLKISKTTDYDKRNNNEPPKNFNESDSYENRLGKIHHTKNSEFKIHFYDRRVYMGDMTEDEFLHFIRRKGIKQWGEEQHFHQVSLAGQCENVQITNMANNYCDICIGMKYDDDAKLVYIGKKHFNFSQSGSRQREQIQLSEAFKIFLDYNKLLDKDNLERQLRKNIERQSGGRYNRSRSRSGSSRSISSKEHKKRDKKKHESDSRNQKRRSHSDSSEQQKEKKKIKKKHESSSISNKQSRSISPRNQKKPQCKII